MTTEKQLQDAVIAICKLYGLHWYHTHDSRRSEPGYPDLTIAGRTLLFRELKREDGKVTRAQADWGDWLIAAGGDWDVWRPSSLASGRVQRELEALRLWPSSKPSTPPARRTPAACARARSRRARGTRCR